jgi:hypothetical protein
MPLETTVQVLVAVLKSDPTVTPKDRAEFLAMLRGRDNKSSVPNQLPETRLLRRKQAAAKLSMSLRTLDKLCASGILTKRTLPGRQRASGIPAAQVDALINGKGETA